MRTLSPGEIPRLPSDQVTDLDLDLQRGGRERIFLFLKIQKTETEIFNRNILEYYRVTDELEREFALKDPKLMLLDPRYPKYGPVGCCSFLQEQYSVLFTAKR